MTATAPWTSWPLEFAVPLTYFALGIAVIRDAPMVAAAILIRWRTKNAFSTILAGMLALHTARWLGAP